MARTSPPLPAANAADETLIGRMAGLWAETTGWLTAHANQIAVAALLAAIIIALLYGLKLLGQWLSRPAPGRTHWAGITGKALRRTRFWFMAAVAAEIVRVMARAPQELSVPIHAGFVVAAALQMAVWARALIIGIMDHRAGEADPAGNLSSALGILRLLVTVALFLLAGVVILANLGVDVTGLLAGLGIGGIAIGLAAQGIFSDLFAALSILFDRPFKKGDTIRFDATTGTVEYIGLKSTRIRAISGEEVVISNAALLGKELRNLTASETRRISQLLSLVYQTPPETCARMADILRDPVNACEGVGFVRCSLDGFGPSSLDFQLVYDVDVEDQTLLLDRKHAVNIAVLKALADSGVAFAYPTQTTFTAAPDGSLVMPWPSPR